jgi:hypothetical protein
VPSCSRIAGRDRHGRQSCDPILGLRVHRLRSTRERPIGHRSWYRWPLRRAGRDDRTGARRRAGRRRSDPQCGRSRCSAIATRMCPLRTPRRIGSLRADGRGVVAREESGALLHQADQGTRAQRHPPSIFRIHFQTNDTQSPLVALQNSTWLSTSTRHSWDGTMDSDSPGSRVFGLPLASALEAGCSGTEHE